MKRFFTSTWSVGARSETGYIRNENQDRMICVRAPFGEMYLVSDGMGGHSGGALAAELTVATVAQVMSRVATVSAVPDATRQALEMANRIVYEQGHFGMDDTAGMGATAVLLVTAGAR